MIQNVDPKERLPEVENIIFSIVHRFHRTYNVPFDELLSEAHFWFVRKACRYDPDRGASFTSWTYFVVYWKLKTYITKRAKRPQETELEEVEHAMGSSDPSNDFLALTEDLSEDAKTIIRILIESPEEMASLFRAGQSSMVPSKILTRIRRWLIHEKEMFPSVVEQAESELKRRYRKTKTTDEWLIETTGLCPGRVRQLTRE